jgi:hypothetical protein
MRQHNITIRFSLILIFIFLEGAIWNDSTYFEKKNVFISGVSSIKQSSTIRDQYIISSTLSFGRLSNLKISIAEIIGLSLALNRTAIFPDLQSCRIGGGLEFNDDIYFEQLFDSSGFTRASVMSKSGIDFDRLCRNDSVSINMNDVGLVKNLPQRKINTSDTDGTSNNTILRDFVSFDELFSMYPYDVHFLPTIISWAKEFMKNPFLPDELALITRRCIYLRGNFMSLNWARLPYEFEEVHKELVPNPSIQADVYDFLQKIRLVDAANPRCSSCFSSVPFIAIHLRMGDFLTSDIHRGFGVDCNKNPDLLIPHLKSAQYISGSLPVILATDDYQSNCAINLQQKIPGIIFLKDVSRFHRNSCRGALFDQEVLGASSFFFGDKMSTFSQSIHQIRTIRYRRASNTTSWI